MKKILKVVVITMVILVIIINSDVIRAFSYYVSKFGDVSKKHIAKEYDIKITDVIINHNNYLFEGTEKDTCREKYVIRIFQKRTYSFYADEGIDKAQAKAIASERGFPTDTVLFLISSSKATELKEYFYWYFINEEGKSIYIKFSNGEVSYVKPQ